MKNASKVLYLIAIFSFPAIAADSFKYANNELRLININDIISSTPQYVKFKGNDGCNYYGTTKDIDKRGGIILSTRLCSSLRQNIKARAYLIELKQPKIPTSLIPAGNGWQVKQDWTSK